MHTRQSPAKAVDCGYAGTFGATKRKNNDSTIRKIEGKFKNTLLFRRMEINENPANFGNYIFNFGEINKDSISAKSDNIKKLYFHLGKWK